MRYIKYIEIAVGLGLGIGPLAGDQLFEVIGFEYSMYSFGGLNLLALLLCIILIPSVLNQTASGQEMNELDQAIKD